MSIRGATPSSSITPCRFEDSKPKTRSSPPAAAMPSTQKIKRVDVYVLVGAAVASSEGYTANFLMNRGARNPRTVLIEAPAIPAESDNAAAQDPGNDPPPAKARYKRCSLMRSGTGRTIMGNQRTKKERIPKPASQFHFRSHRPSPATANTSIHSRITNPSYFVYRLKIAVEELLPRPRDQWEILRQNRSLGQQVFVPANPTQGQISSTDRGLRCWDHQH